MSLRALDLGRGFGAGSRGAQRVERCGYGGLVGRANAQPGPDFAALVPAVLDCAHAGDAVAGDILERAGRELALQIDMVWTRLRARGDEAMGLAYTGSVVEKVERVRAAMLAALPAALHVAGLAVPLEGALWRARRLVR